MTEPGYDKNPWEALCDRIIAIEAERALKDPGWRLSGTVILPAHVWASLVGLAELTKRDIEAWAGK